MQRRPEFRLKPSIAIADQRVGQAHVSKYRAFEVCSGRRQGHRLERWDKPDAPRSKVDEHMQEKKPSGATMFGFDALASGAGADECFHV